MEEKIYGAPIERGTVLNANNQRPTVESIDRPGAITGPLQVLQGMTVSSGDTVFYCAFDDGSGLVLAVYSEGDA